MYSSPLSPEMEEDTLKRLQRSTTEFSISALPKDLGPRFIYVPRHPQKSVPKPKGSSKVTMNMLGAQQRSKQHPDLPSKGLLLITNKHK